MTDRTADTPPLTPAEASRLRDLSQSCAAAAKRESNRRRAERRKRAKAYDRAWKAQAEQGEV